MDCQEFQLFVQPYIDGEFAPEDAAPLEAHVEVCPTCRALVEREAAFRHHIRAVYHHEPAPDALKLRIADVLEAQDAVELAAAEPPAPDAEPAPRRRAAVLRRAEWVLGPTVAAAAVALLVVLALNHASAPPPLPPSLPASPALTPISAPLLRPDVAVAERGASPIVEEAVTWHRRNLPIEVAGPSDLRVRRWFDGKVNFPVRLPEFDRQAPGQVNLLGARLSNVKERQAAYVVYEVKGSKMSVMAFDGKDLDPNRVDDGQPIIFENANGYNVAVVEDNGITYSITSELPRADMEKLVQTAFKPAP